MRDDTYRAAIEERIGQFRRQCEAAGVDPEPLLDEAEAISRSSAEDFLSALDRVWARAGRS